MGGEGRDALDFFIPHQNSLHTPKTEHFYDSFTHVCCCNSLGIPGGRAAHLPLYETLGGYLMYVHELP